MSTFEYNDLFVLSQDSGRYHVYTFDIVNSKKMDAEARKIAQEKLIKLMMSIYQLIGEIQEKLRIQILVFDDNFVTYDSGLHLNGFCMKREPFLMGDTFCFTIDYGEAGTKYFRGYCIDLLSNFHKEKNVTTINKLKKRIIKPDSNWVFFMVE